MNSCNTKVCAFCLITNSCMIMSVEYLLRDLLVAFVCKDTPAEGDEGLDRSCWWPSRDTKLTSSPYSPLLTGTRRKGDRSKFTEGSHWPLMGVECLGYVRRSSWLSCLCSVLGSAESFMSYWLIDKRNSNYRSSFEMLEGERENTNEYTKEYRREREREGGGAKSEHYRGRRHLPVMA